MDKSLWGEMEEESSSEEESEEEEEEEEDTSGLVTPGPEGWVKWEQTTITEGTLPWILEPLKFFKMTSYMSYRVNH